MSEAGKEKSPTHGSLPHDRLVRFGIVFVEDLECFLDGDSDCNGDVGVKEHLLEGFRESIHQRDDSV